MEIWAIESFPSYVAFTNGPPNKPRCSVSLSLSLLATKADAKVIQLKKETKKERCKVTRLQLAKASDFETFFDRGIQAPFRPPLLSYTEHPTYWVGFPIVPPTKHFVF